MILPVAKLASLLVKTLCKPIANRIKKEAAYHPKFRSLIINVAQANHQFTTQLQRRSYGHATNVAIRPLNEEKAVQAAADLLGELFVFSVAGTALIFEVQRSSRSDARKEALRRQEIEAMKQRDEEIAREVEMLKLRLLELEQIARGRGLTGIFNFKHANATEKKAKTS